MSKDNKEPTRDEHGKPIKKQTGKRGNGEGTISQLPDGRWCARITVGRDKVGKQKRKAFYGKTRKEVQEKLLAAVNEMNNGVYIDPTKMTVEQWIDIYLEDYRKRSVKPATYAKDLTLAKPRIIPAIGDIKLKDLRVEP